MNPGEQVGLDDVAGRPRDELALVVGRGGGFGGGGYSGGYSAGGFDGYESPQPPAKGENLTTSTLISFDDMLKGTTVRLRRSDGKTTTVKVPQGVRDGQKLKLRGKGHDGPGGPGGGPGEPPVAVLAVRVDHRHPVLPGGVAGDGEVRRRYRPDRRGTGGDGLCGVQGVVQDPA